ncbi:MAG: TonB-dependent receptor [Candidatus Sericytochromatia bacterium]
MYLKKKSLLLSLALSFFATTNAFSEEKDLNSLSLEELLNIEVSSASKKLEKIQDSPGIITAYPSKLIEEYGYYSVSDLANITPGYSSYLKYGEKVFETRGQKADSFNNNKHLTLIDGIPINHARAFKSPIEEELPIFFAKQVEFLRGPASSLYGTSAFYGVINIVPKTLKENGFLLESKMFGGTNNFSKKAMANALIKNDTGEARISLGYYKKDASRNYVGIKDSNDNLFWDDQNSTFLNLSYKLNSTVFQGLGFGLIYMSKNGGLGEHWMESAFTHQLNDITWETFIPYIKYQKALTDNFSINSYAKYNQGMEKGWWAPFTNESYAKYDGTGNIFSAYDARVDNFEALLEAKYDPLDWLNIIAGVNVDSRYQKGNPDSYDYNFNAGIKDSTENKEAYLLGDELKNPSALFSIYSAYSQVSTKFPVLKELLITLGARGDYGTSSILQYQQLSPRIALVQKLNDNFNLKLLWGNALRGPGLKEFGLNTSAKQKYGTEIKDIKAETISTLEGGLTFNNDNVSSTLTYFNNSTINALDGTRYKDSNIFVNSEGVIQASGVEAETSVALNKDFNFFANYSFAQALDSKGKELNDIPIHKANFGINYTLNAPFNLNSSLVGKWISDYRVTDSKLNRPSGNFTLDLNFSSRLLDNLTAEFQIRNLLDMKYKLPKNGLPDIPMAGRTFIFGLGYQL